MTQPLDQVNSAKTIECFILMPFSPALWERSGIYVSSCILLIERARDAIPLVMFRPVFRPRAEDESTEEMTMDEGKKFFFLKIHLVWFLRVGWKERTGAPLIDSLLVAVPC